jgi:hypothetical protein
MTVTESIKHAVGITGEPSSQCCHAFPRNWLCT